MSLEDMQARTSARVSAWNRHESAEYAAYYSENTSVSDPQYPEPLIGRDAVRKDFEAFLTTFPDSEFSLGTVVASEDTVAFEVVARGTHLGPLPGPGGAIPPTNRTVEMPIAAFSRLDDQGLIKEERRYFDVAGLLEQLGLSQS